MRCWPGLVRAVPDKGDQVSDILSQTVPVESPSRLPHFVLQGMRFSTFAFLERTYKVGAIKGLLRQTPRGAKKPLHAKPPNLSPTAASCCGVFFCLIDRPGISGQPAAGREVDSHYPVHPNPNVEEPIRRILGVLDRSASCWASTWSLPDMCICTLRYRPSAPEILRQSPFQTTATSAINTPNSACQRHFLASSLWIKLILSPA